MPLLEAAQQLDADGARGTDDRHDRRAARGFLRAHGRIST